MSDREEDNLAYFAEMRQAAKAMYEDDDTMIDDDAAVSEADSGCWVQAWVWVPNATNEKEVTIR